MSDRILIYSLDGEVYHEGGTFGSLITPFFEDVRTEPDQTKWEFEAEIDVEAVKNLMELAQEAEAEDPRFQITYKDHPFPGVWVIHDAPVKWDEPPRLYFREVTGLFGFGDRVIPEDELVGLVGAWAKIMGYNDEA